MEFDDICTFDENGICTRHKTKHEGRFYRLSQDRSSVGHQYRKIWDKTLDPYGDICTFDENGVCTRHHVVHEGKLHEISQERSLRGQRIRLHWDKKPEEITKDARKNCNCGG